MVTTQFEFIINKENGEIAFDDPGVRYKRPHDRRNVNAPVGQKYCKFKTVDTLPKASGVYALFVNDDANPVYIGRSKNLFTRWSNRNYCSISPKNVFYNGQSTNCKINHYFLERKQAGDSLILKYCTTDDYVSLEKELIAQFNPIINVQGVR